MTTALKDLAVELNVSIFTSTQVNAAADNNQYIRNEASLAGGRATINKADNGCIMARPKPEELDTIKELIESTGIEPNIVTDVFKVRSGQWTQVRIWTYFNAGTLRKRDLFVTNERMEPLKDFQLSNYQVRQWEDGEEQLIRQLVEDTNNGIALPETIQEYQAEHQPVDCSF